MEIKQIEIIQKLQELDPDHGLHFIHEAIDFYCCSVLGEPRPVNIPSVPKFHFIELAKGFRKWDDEQRATALEGRQARVADAVKKYFGSENQDEDSDQNWNEIEGEEEEKEIMDRLS